MNDELRTEIRERVRAAVSRVGRPTPEIERVFQRGNKLSRRRRIGALLLAAAVGTGTVIVVATNLPLPFRSVTDRSIDAAQSSERPPEGKLLVRSGNMTTLLSRASGARELAGRVLGYDISPDGTRLVAGRSGQGTAVASWDQLVLVEVAGGRPGASSVLVEAASGDSFEPPLAWSRDGTRIGYRYAEGGATTDPPRESLACVLEVATRATRCFPDAGTTFWLDWSSAEELILAGPPDAPLKVLNATTGQSSVLIDPADPQIRDAIQDSGLGTPSSIQLVSPTWSPSGRYVASTAMVNSDDGQFGSVGGVLPLIITRNGNVAARGEPNPELRDFAWSPTEDVLAYATGILVEPPTARWDVHLLDASTGNDTVVASKENVENQPGSSDPFILQLVWSPSGRFLAASGRESILLVDFVDNSTQQLDVYPRSVPGDLLDWSP